MLSSSGKFLTKLLLVLCTVLCVGQTQNSYQSLKLLNCKQSSTYRNETCERAIDGVEDPRQIATVGSCSRVEKGTIGWWQAELDRPALIFYVWIIRNRACCSESFKSFKLSVDGRVCFEYRETGKNIAAHGYIHCFATGTLLKIESRKPDLSICAIEAGGRYLRSRNILNLTKCYQSSIYKGLSCEKAIDGIKSQDFAAKSCSRVEEDVGGWWEAETDKPAFFWWVGLYNRQDCCADRLSKFQISVDGKVCYTYAEEVFSLKFFKCQEPGMSLRIDSSRPALTLCEVSVIGAYCSILPLSNITQNSSGLCDNKRRGNTSLALPAAASSVKSKFTAWWKAKTARMAKIEFFQIRQHCCAEKLTDFKITVDNSVCFVPGGRIYSAEFFPCSQIGSLLRIDSSKPYSTLCEVNVFGEYTYFRLSLSESMQFSKCKQSSEDPNQVSHCDKAIDGNKSQIFLNSSRYSCSHVGPEPTGWWKAEFVKKTYLQYIGIYTRVDCCADALTDFKISIRDRAYIDVCVIYKGAKFSTRIFRCREQGHNLQIDSGKPHLTLCEVTAFGTYALTES